MLVRTSYETAPTWVQSVALGLAFDAFWVLSQKLLFAHDWGETLASGVLASAVYGIVVGPVAAKKRRVARTEAGLDALPVHHQRTALRAARRGPAPTDPEVRHAALRLAAHRCDRIHAQRVLPPRSWPPPPPPPRSPPWPPPPGGGPPPPCSPASYSPT